MDAISVEEVVRRTLESLSRGSSGAKPVAIPVGVSNRHVHLCEQDVKTLFGPEASLTVLRDLSQPGQFVAGELVQIAGPHGAIANARVLGPTRSRTQVEISRTDAFRLGLRPPVRDSGDLDGTPGAVLLGPAGSVVLREGVILAARHVHMHPSDADRLSIHDRQLVDVEVTGPRAGVMRNVLVRVDERYLFELHVDTDEANAYCLQNGDVAWLQPRPLASSISLAKGSGIVAAPAAAARAESPAVAPLTLVTERDVREAAKRDRQVLASPAAVVTPLARDAIRDLKVSLITTPPGGGGGAA